MKTKRSLITLALSLGLTLAAGFLVLTGRAAPGNPVLDPAHNSHTAPLSTTVSITYDEPIDPSTVTSRTFAVHGMQSGLVTVTHGVHDSTIIVTPTRPFHQGELVYAIATTRTLNITGTEPISSTQWQFNAGNVFSRCVGGFTDIDAGLAGVHSGAVAWGDYDNDGDLDILLSGWNDSSGVSRIYRNDNGIFTDIGASLTDVGDGSAAWGDYDNDGDLDVLLTGEDATWNSVSQVYRNDGADTFTDIDAGLSGVSGGSTAWGDYDNDGDLDVLLTGWSSSGEVSLVYRNNGPASGWTFTDIGATLTGVGSSSAAWGDYDNDGDLDILLIGYDTSLGYASRVYRNDGPASGWTFSDTNAGIVDVNNGSVAWGDYDNDGDLDILLMGYGASGRVSRVYRNNGPASGWTFSDANAGLSGVRDGSAAWGDYDNDGDLDILLTGDSFVPDSLTRVYRNNGPAPGWTFSDAAVNLTGISSSSANWGDYDNDGDLDILLAGYSARDYDYVSRVYRNDDCVPDLIIAKSVSPQITAPGQPITYTLNFYNAATMDGPTAIATGIVITDVVPVSVTINNVFSSGVAITNTVTGPAYVWNAGDLAFGEGGVITITGVLSTGLPLGSVFSNTAAITTTTPDSNPFNNSDAAQVWVGHGVADVSPVPNSHDAALDTNLVVTMSGTLSQTSVTTQTLFVHGGFQGHLDGVISFSNTDGYSQTTYTPDDNFFPGELIRASVTTSTLNNDGVPIARPHVWSFRTKTLGGSGSFRDSGNRLGDDSSRDIALGDLDGDNDLDAIVTRYGQPAQVWENDGNGNFSESANTLNAGYSDAIALGDLDGDGDLDAFIGSPTGGPDTVWLNDGSGAFSDSGNRLGQSVNYDVALGDLDGDGDLDAYVVNDNDPNAVWLNDGDGNFEEGDHMGYGFLWSRAVALGDVDGDGDLDAFVANTVDPSRVWLNDGSGEFYDSHNDFASSHSEAVALGDLDGDGDLDAFVTNIVDQPDKVWLNDGSGNFSASDNDLSTSWNYTVALGDLDGDGDLDAFVGSDSKYHEIWMNDGNGNLSEESNLPYNSDIASIALGDLDGDGELDAFLADWNNTDKVWLNRNGGDLSIVKHVDTTPSIPGQAIQGQTITYTLTFVNNGPELATGVVITDHVPVSVTNTSVVSSGVAITDSGAIPAHVWNVQNLAPGQGGVITITGVVSATLPDGYTLNNSTVITSAVEDDSPTNNSSSVDIIISPLNIIATDPLPQALSVSLTTTVNATFDADVDTGTVTSATFAVHGMMGGLVTGTLNYNSPSRTLTLTPSRAFHAGEVVRTSATSSILNTGGTPLIPYQWEFSAGQIVTRCIAGFSDISAGLAAASYSSVAWGDYDNDGDLDILLTGSGRSQVYRNDGGTFSDINAGMPGVYGSSAAWGDYDNDGDLDILLTGSDLSEVYRNDGTAFTDIDAGLVGVQYGSVAWGDYDNDGDLDILLTGSDVSQVYRNDGAIFTDINAGLPGVSGSSVAWGDYDNDGDLDILITGEYDSTAIAKVYQNDGEGTFSDVDAGLAGIDYGSVAWGDYDNDGDLDILLTGNEVSRVYRNDGSTFTDIDARLIGVEVSSAAWGDYDNDGDLDILLTGYDGDDPITRVYRNNGDNTFSDIAFGLPGVENSSVAWGDYDNDGDLDILLTGYNDDMWISISRIYRNDDCVPDLSIVKTVTPQFAEPGDTITYTLDFSSNGTLTTTHVVITDHVPVSVTNTSVVSSGVAITDTGTSPLYVWNVQDLVPGDGGIITITGVLSDPLSSSVFTNTAVITSAEEDDNPTDNSSSVDVTISPLNVIATNPPPLAIGVPLTTTVNATFDADLDVGTVTSATFAVHGMLGGLVTGILSYDGPGRTLTLTPSRAFHAGEVVRTSATDGILNAKGTHLIPYQWEFTAGQITNRCAGGFSDISAGLIGVTHSSAAWGDYDNDGDLDILLAGYFMFDSASLVYHNDGATFTDINAGLTNVSDASVAWGDYDNDGDLDIFLAGSSSSGSVSQVYRNDDGTFTEINAGLPGISNSSVAWGDYDNDGDLDILLTGYISSIRVSRVYRNDGSTFTDINAGLIGVGYGSVAWGDYDNDGDLDILLTGSTSTSRVSRVYRNDSNIFTDINAGLTGVYNSSVAWGDYDNDGDLDILLAGYTGSGSISQVYRNDDTTFTDINAGLTRVRYASVAWGDYDNDGDLDILLTGEEGLTAITQVYQNNGNGTFDDANFDLTGVYYGTGAWGDYDNDGDLDILLTGDYSVSRVYRNDDCGSDLGIVKTVTPQFAEPGDMITYTLAFSNSGMLTATHVVISDHIPVSVTSTSVVSSGVVITDSGVSPAYVWSVQDLAPGDGGVITITGVLSASLPDGILNNTAVISTTSMDQNPDNNHDSADITIANEPPEPPVLLSPPNEALINDATPTLTWNPSVDADGYIINLDGTVIDVGNVTEHTMDVLADRYYTWTVAAYDVLSNTSAYTYPWAFELDATAPDTTITGNPPDPSTSADAAFQFTGDDGSGSGVESFECQLDSGGWSTCTSPQNYVGLSSGSHTFEAQAIDYAGNPDATPATYTWTIATGAPVLGVFKSVDTGGLAEMPLGGTVTYTIIISNSGDSIATSVVMTDPLPTAITFGTQSEGSALLALPGNVYQWGPWDVAARDSYTIAFTAIITGNDDFAGDTITNSAYTSADNASSDSDDAILNTKGDFYIYLPVVLKNH